MRYLTPPSMLPNATRASGSSTLRNTARLRPDMHGASSDVRSWLVLNSNQN